MIADEGPAAVGSMWMMAVIILVLAALRTYTRAVIVRSVGWDDHAFNVSTVLFLLYTIFLTVAAYYGFGQDVWALGIEEAVSAVEYEMIGISFVIIGMSLAKWSMGLFLLRIVVTPWHKVTIWLAMGLLGCMSVTACTLFWVQCLPSRSIYDPRVEGKCSINISIVSYVYGAICILVDFFFAGFPWVFIWNLNMAKKEKMTIALSLSLGFFAGICGIIRTLELGGFNTQNFTKDTIKLNVWSAAEMTVTMVCIAIPVCRPLYKRVVHGSSYRKQSDDGSGKPESHDLRPVASHRDLAGKLKLGINGPFTKTDITRDDHDSEEQQMLDAELGASVPDSIGGIRVKENVKVEWTPRMK